MIRFYRHRTTGRVIATNDAIPVPHANGVACITAQAVDAPGATKTLTAMIPMIGQNYYEISSESAKVHNGAVWAMAWLLWQQRPYNLDAADHLRKLREEES